MLGKKDEYVRVTGESLARVRVTGEILPVRKQRRVARLEDVAFLAEAAAERRGKDAGSVTVGMTRFGTVLATYADLAEGHLDAAKLAEAKLDFEDWCEKKDSERADIDKAKAERDAAKETARTALDAALNEADAKYQQASADAKKAEKKAEKTLEKARSKFEKAKSDAARRRQAEVEAIDEETMDAAEILAATLSAYGNELAEVEEARRSLGKAEAGHRRAMNKADAAKRTAAAELEAAQAAARTAEAEAVSAADAAYRDALKEYGAAELDVLSEVDATIATLAPYDAISAYGGVVVSWVSAELVERAFAVADAATVRNLGEHSASSLVVGVETRKENSSFSSGGEKPQKSSHTSTRVGYQLGCKYTNVSSGSHTDEDTSKSTSYSSTTDVTYSLKHALLAVDVGGRHDAVKAVRGVVVVSALGETGRAQKSAMVEFEKAKSSSRYADFYKAVDALDDEIAAGQKKRDALAAVVEAAAKKDYDAALAALVAERDEAVAKARAKADAKIANLRAAYAEAVMEPLFAWNAATDTAARGTAEANIASLGETLAEAVDRAETAYKKAVTKADDDLKTLREEAEPGIKATYDEAVAAGLEPIDADWNEAKAVLDEKREKAYREGAAAAEDMRAALNAERSAALATLKEANESADTTAVEIHYAKELFAVPDFDLSARERWECDVSSLAEFGSSLYSFSSTESSDGDTSVTNSFSSEVHLARLFVEYGYRATTDGTTRDFETLDADG